MFNRFHKVTYNDQDMIRSKLPYTTNNHTTWEDQHQKQHANYLHPPLPLPDQPQHGPEREHLIRNNYTPRVLPHNNPNGHSHLTLMHPHPKPKRVPEEQYMARRSERGISSRQSEVEDLDLVEKRTMVGHLARSGTRSSVSFCIPRVDLV